MGCVHRRVTRSQREVADRARGDAPARRDGAGARGDRSSLSVMRVRLEVCVREEDGTGQFLDARIVRWLSAVYGMHVVVLVQ